MIKKLKEHEKIKALLDEAYSLRTSSLATSIKTANEALGLSRALNYQPLVVKSLTHLSLFHTMATDYTQSIQLAEEALEMGEPQTQMELIVQKNEELVSFFHRVSHDLKGSITSLISLDVIMRDDLKDEKALPLMDMAITQVYRINHILNELIKLARITDEKEVIQEINFEEIIDECLTTASVLINFDKVAIKHKVQPDINFIAPWALVNTIIQNLVENGINYARVDGLNPSFEINISKEKDKIKILASDNGIGMSKNTGKNIFEMFYQANKEVDGSGMGLYILIKAVQELGGRVDLESEVGTGSTFTIILPITK